MDAIVENHTNREADEIAGILNGTRIFDELREAYYWVDENGETHHDIYPALSYSDGTEMWFHHGKIHRDGDLPAIMSKGGNHWFWFGLRHRGNGPAIERPDGKKEYYWFDCHLSKEDYFAERAKNIEKWKKKDVLLANLTGQEK